MRNLQPLHFSYISGVINEFHETLEQAIEKASEPENGCWFNNSWMQATTGTYEIGELELHGNVAMAIDHTGRYESIADVSQIPWVEWGKPANQRSNKLAG